MRSFNRLTILAVLFGGIGLFWAAYSIFKGQETNKAAAQLSLFRSTIGAELERFSHLPFVLSLDPLVAQTLEGGDPGILDKRLARIAQSAGVDAIYLMDLDGLTIAASNARTARSFVGQNYQYRPYFQEALNGELGEFYGIGATTGIPGYFFAIAVRPSNAQGRAQSRGVVAIKVDLSALQTSWQSSGARIMLSNSDGVVLLASDPEWRYRTLVDLSPEQLQRIRASRQFGKESLALLDWQPDGLNQTARIGGNDYLYLTSTDLPNSWSLHYFAPNDQVFIRAALITGGYLLLSGLLFIFVQVRRERRIGAALQRSESEEAQLRLANERLAVEIDERLAAEKSLKKTQAELERAGRLAALGQLASSVTHELGQPIAAMRNQLAAAEMASGKTALGDKMQGLVARMEDITRQLKFFSRKGRDMFETIDLIAVMGNALELLEATIEKDQVAVSFQHDAAPVLLHGNKLRIEQVMTNIVRNALDAMEESATRELRIEVAQDANEVWFEVQDTGHGLGDMTLEDLREPFTTTRASGKGMGLGLTITAGIVNDHGGTMTAKSLAEGGALFRVAFPAQTGERDG